ncbi:MAG: hypothetical protein KDG55_00625 [Rhodocyclaceae bacterium]|nr:hypothetical protein [Rhodocyclaceae bacterium]
MHDHDNADGHFDMERFLRNVPKQAKSYDQLVAEGKVSPETYRSILFLMKACGNGFIYPPSEPIDIDAKIAEMTALIDARKASEKGVQDGNN